MKETVRYGRNSSGYDLKCTRHPCIMAKKKRRAKALSEII